MQPILLIGFMGSGKSHIGKMLAQHLNLSFLDLDAVLESNEGRKIADIFAKEGETFFRNLETQTLEKFGSTTYSVISLGGGAPCFNNNMALVKKLGISFYLQAPAEVLAQRLFNERAHRPILNNTDELSFTSFIEGKLLERNPFYKQAHYTINAAQKDVDIVRDIEIILTRI